MSDDIAQICKLEMDGVTYAIKGSLKVAQFLISLLKHIRDFMEKKILEHPGEHKFKSIQKRSEGEPRVINFPTDKLDDFLMACKNSGLPYCCPPDFNANDSFVPVMFASQDAPLAASLSKKFLSESVSEYERKFNSLNNQISELEEKRLHVSPEERRVLNTEIEHFEQARDELNQIRTGYDKLASDDPFVSFSEYLASGKGTTVEKDPKGVLNGMLQGGESVQMFKASDTFKPIRSKELIPDSKVCFVIPETGAMVTRKFELDEYDNVYSLYSFRDKFNKEIKDSSGNPIVFSDKDVTTDEWMNGNKENANLKDFLSHTGIMADTLCEYYDNETALKAALYRMQEYESKFKVMKEKKSDLNNSKDFSSDEVKAEALYAVDQNDRSIANADISTENRIFEVSSDKAYVKDGVVSIINEEGTYSFRNVDLKAADEGMYKFSVKSSSSVMFTPKGESNDKSVMMDAKNAHSKFYNAGSQSDTSALFESLGKGKDR